MGLNKYDFEHQDIFLLLGPQEVGKTCFLSGIYYAFRSSLNGFSLSCANEEQKVDLNSMCKGLDNGVFPMGTGVSTKYDFVLRYANEKRFAFSWFDYRGKTIEEYGTTDQKEYDELVDIVNNTTCILICVDGTWLSSDKEKSVKNIQDNSFMINDFLNIYQDNNGKLPPICVVITKIDLCRKEFMNLYYDAIKESFPFFENNNIPIYICPICIGHISSQSKKFAFDPIDKDVYRPLLFALWCGYSYKIAGMKKDLLKKRILFEPMIKKINDQIKKINDRVVIINKEKRLSEKRKDLRNIENSLSKQEYRIQQLEKEQMELFNTFKNAQKVLWGNKDTNWEEINEKWKFFQ